jgi:hypothetical protein
VSAGEPRSERRPIANWLVLALAAATGYVAVQVMAAASRIEALERDHIRDGDELHARTERLARQVALLRGIVASKPRDSSGSH